MAPAQKLAIIGWPVSHSRSPLMHNYWLKAHAIDGVYERYPIAPEDNFRAALEAMAAQGFIGANVTVPHKEAAFAAMDELSPAAASLGAVNTISFTEGKLVGDNTDGDGFLASLDAAAPNHDWRDRPVLVIGAGGAARAIIAGLGRAGVGDIRLVNRTRAKAEALTGLAANISVDDWHARDTAARGCALLVNTTSLGMQGQPPLEMSLDRLRPNALVSDIVYTPLRTPLLQAAGTAGHIAVNGLGMLMQQAALAFEVWFGRRPAVDAVLEDMLLEDLNADDSGRHKNEER